MTSFAIMPTVNVFIAIFNKIYGNAIRDLVTRDQSSIASTSAALESTFGMKKRDIVIKPVEQVASMLPVI